MTGSPPRRRVRVAYWVNQPAPYFVGRFNAVADRGTLDFEAWFSETRQPDRSWEVDPSQWRFRARSIPGRRLPLTRGRLIRFPLREMRELRPDVLVLEYDRAHFAVTALAATALAGRVCLRVLPNFDAWSRRTWWREAAKALLFRSVDGAKVPGPAGASLAVRYGLPRRRTWTVTQSIDVVHYGSALAVDADERARLRESLHLHGCVFLYIGRLWDGKGVSHLLDAYEIVRAAEPDVSLLLVGDGVDEARYRARAATLPGVAFAGFVQAFDIPRVAAAADVFVFPTLGDPNGLVVEEALASGLPVITTSAAGDIAARVPDPETTVVPPADPHALADRMVRLARSPAERSRLAAAGLALVADRGHDRYAEDFETFILGVLASGRRGGGVARSVRAAARVFGARGRRAGDPDAGRWSAPADQAEGP